MHNYAALSRYARIDIRTTCTASCVLVSVATLTDDKEGSLIVHKLVTLNREQPMLTSSHPHLKQPLQSYRCMGALGEKQANHTTQSCSTNAAGGLVACTNFKPSNYMTIRSHSGAIYI